jgi:hypothetical protein
VSAPLSVCGAPGAASISAARWLRRGRTSHQGCSRTARGPRSTNGTSGTVRAHARKSRTSDPRPGSPTHVRPVTAATGRVDRLREEQLGHASIQITMDTYGHLIPGANRAAVDRLDDAPMQPNATQAQPEPTRSRCRSPRRLELGSMRARANPTLRHHLKSL